MLAGALALAWTDARAIQLTSGPYSVADFEWSPDDATIAFIEMADSTGSRVARVPAAGGAVTVLTSAAPFYTTPHWTADGLRLLTSYFSGGSFQVCALNAASGLCDYTSGPGRYAPRFGPLRSPFQIVACAVATDSTRRLVLLDLVGGTEIMLTPAADEGQYVPLWVSGGRGVLVESFDGGGLLQIFEVPSGGGPPSQVTSLSSDVGGPDEAVDGTLVFVSNSGDANLQLWTQAGVGSPVKITSVPVDHFTPVWSADGTRVVFGRPDAQTCAAPVNIYTVLRSGGPELQLTNGPGLRRLGKLSHDGGRLAYLQSDPITDSTSAWNLYVVSLGITPTAASVVRANTEPGRVEIEWRVSASAATLLVYRSSTASIWQIVGAVTPDAQGNVAFEDRAVAAGSRYGYRLGWTAPDGSELIAGEVWVDVPRAPRLALGGFRPNPSGGDPQVVFTLSDRSSATLELFDVRGRRVLVRELGSLGPGEHVVSLSTYGGLDPGLWFVRLTQKGVSVTARAAVVR